MLSASRRVFSTAEPSIIPTHTGYVCNLRLSRPKALNSLDLPMIRDMQVTMDKWNTLDSAKVVMFKGEGPKAFCAGGDVRALYNAKKSGQTSILRDFFWYEYILDYTIAKMRPIHVAIYNGIVMGGGVGISIHAPIRIATGASVFAMPETAIGLFPDVGGSYFLPRLKPGLGNYFGLIGAKLTGKSLVSAGIATHYMETEKIKPMSDAMVERVNANSTLEDVRQIVEEFSTPVHSRLLHIDRIQKNFSTASSVEEIVENLKRDKSDWAKKMLAMLANASQISLKVVFEQIRRGAKLSLADCFKQEFRMTQNFMNGNDFFEGVRAVLVEKNSKPNWQFKTLEEISKEEVLKYFEKVTPEQQDLDVERRC